MITVFRYMKSCHLKKTIHLSLWLLSESTKTAHYDKPREKECEKEAVSSLLEEVLKWTMEGIVRMLQIKLSVTI